MTKLKNSNCDETKKLKLWQNSKTQIVTGEVSKCVSLEEFLHLAHSIFLIFLILYLYTLNKPDWVKLLFLAHSFWSNLFKEFILFEAPH